MRYKLEISYDGILYYGFQKQINKKTIQDELESALKLTLNDAKVSIIASGRTDSGVSALKQICHFDYDGKIDDNGFVGRINSLLSANIRVMSIQNADNNFHARFSAKLKTYCYNFYFNKINIPYYDRFATNLKYDLDVVAMQQACQYFIGYHNFKSFCASDTQVKDFERIIKACYIQNDGSKVYKLIITGNGFLYNMVRIIMGTLFDVGRGKIKPSEIENIINKKDRKFAGKTVDSKGLLLLNVEYD